MTGKKQRETELEDLFAAVYWLRSEAGGIVIIDILLTLVRGSEAGDIVLIDI